MQLRREQAGPAATDESGRLALAGSLMAIFEPAPPSDGCTDPSPEVLIVMGPVPTPETD